MVQSTMEAYLSAVSNRLNETMKRLTVVGAVLSTLMVITGVYGMNFEHMPELKWRYGYLFALGLMAGATVDADLLVQEEGLGLSRGDMRAPTGGSSVSPTTSSTRSRRARWWSGRPRW